MESSEEGALVLVTGAAGYIGTHIVQQLQQAGYRVRGSIRAKATNPHKVSALKSLCPDARYTIDVVEAELTDQQSWIPATKDCQYVIHVASPFPIKVIRNEEELIRPSVEGTLNVLRACKKAGTVKRVVLTSSMAAIAYGHTVNNHEPLNESDWTDVTKKEADAYIKSKTLAEKCAWNFVADYPPSEIFELAVVNPALVLGPVLYNMRSTSIEIPKKLLLHEIPMIPRVNLGIVDVRDVAHAHLKAMTLPEAAGNRHIICKQNIWCVDMARIIHSEFKSQGYNVPVKVVPDCVLHLMGLFDKSIRKVASSVGKKRDCDNQRMKAVLGVMPRDIRDTIIDMCYSLIENGIVEKTASYRGSPPADAVVRFQHSSHGGQIEN